MHDFGHKMFFGTLEAPFWGQLVVRKHLGAGACLIRHENRKGKGKFFGKLMIFIKALIAGS